MIRPRTRLALSAIAALLLATACQQAPAPLAPPPAAAATGSLRVKVAPAARTLQGEITRVLTTRIDHYRATLARLEPGDLLVAVPDAAGVPEGGAGDIYFSGLAAGQYRVEVSGEDAGGLAVTTAVTAFVDVVAGAGATATLPAPTLLGTPFAGKLTLPETPEWMTEITVTVDPDDPLVAPVSETFDLTGAGPHFFGNLPVGGYAVTYAGTDGLGSTDAERVRVEWDEAETTLETDLTAAFTFGSGPFAPTVASQALALGGATAIGLAGSFAGGERTAVAADDGAIHVALGTDPATTPITGLTDLAPGLTYDAEGSLYFIDGDALQRLTAGGATELVATLAAGSPQLPFHQANTIYFHDAAGTGAIVEIGATGASEAVMFTGVGTNVTGLVRDDAGFFTVGYADGAIRSWSADGTFSEVLVPAGRYGTQARLAVEPGPGALLYFCFDGDHAIYRRDNAGEIVRMAGTNYLAGSTDGDGDGATFGDLVAITLKGGNITVYDQTNQAFRSF